MATATMVRPKEATGNWSRIFPNEQVKKQQSTLFVKKLLAVAISNITYLRTIFPEHAFGDRCLEDLNLKILCDDSACPGACQVINWVKGCFDALERQYLRIIVLAIYKNTCEADNIVEAYTFKFSYTDNKESSISIYRNGSKLATAHSPEETRKATIHMLRTIVVLTQTLMPLPDDVMLTMNLAYYDEVTPPDYEPPGFKPTVMDQKLFKADPSDISAGEVSTPFHTVKLRVRSKCHQFVAFEEEEETKEMDTTQESVNGTVEVDPVTAAISPPMDYSLPTGEQAIGDANLPQEDASVPQHDPTEEVEGVEDKQNPDSNVVRCPCGCNEDDGLMVLCGYCNTWQHGVCFTILEEEQAPELHICVQCAQTVGRECTDVSLTKLNTQKQQDLCTWRRALMACTEQNKLLTSVLAKRLGVDVEVAQGLVSRLEKEGYVKQAARLKKHGGKLVNTNKILTDGVNKYFRQLPASSDHGDQTSTAPPQHTTHTSDNECGVEQLTHQASSLALNKKTNPSSSSNKLSSVPKDVHGESVRRSPRIARKRVRSVTDPNAVFEIALSQDLDTTSSTTGEERKKRKKTSITSRSVLV